MTLDRRYTLGSGLFGLGHGLRVQFPLLDRGRETLGFLHTTLSAGCSMSKIGQRFPIGPPFGLVAMASRDEDAIDGWLRRVTA